jgi:hypothetical protein
MTQIDRKTQFKATLLRPAGSGGDALWAFVVLPRDASDKLPRRGRTTVTASLNGTRFQVTLEPDGQLSHWLRVDELLLKTAGAEIGDVASFEIAPVEQEPEPELPSDFALALDASTAARVGWDATSTLARVDWIHWIVSAKQARTRAQRIANACEMLASGKRRVCCFDPSGYYSKAFSAPKLAD